ncbi:hypothetical protein QCE48_30670, partial [Caballeronia sp. LZ024]
DLVQLTTSIRHSRSSPRPSHQQVNLKALNINPGLRFTLETAELMKIKLIDKDINYAHGIGVRYVVVECVGEEKALITIVALNEPFHLAHPPL